MESQVSSFFFQWRQNLSRNGWKLVGCLIDGGKDRVSLTPVRILGHVVGTVGHDSRLELRECCGVKHFSGHIFEARVIDVAIGCSLGS
jgi:hypothetical protein